MKYRPSNKKFIDEDDEEIKILDELEKLEISEENYHQAKFINEIHLKFLREGRISVEQYNRLVDIYSDHFDPVESEIEARRFLVLTNRRKAISLQNEYAHLMPKDYPFFIKEKTIDMKKKDKVSSVDLSSNYAIQLLKNHIMLHIEGDK